MSQLQFIRCDKWPDTKNFMLFLLNSDGLTTATAGQFEKKNSW